ncbi:MAG: protein-L-isoaspartate(D-aspartate) O-methyltransferase [Nanoarchaeota archaeon]
MTKQELLSFWQSSGMDERILHAFAEIPRELFVSVQLQPHAYDDVPLPTIRKQSISQPTTIMLMLQTIDLQPGEKVLEVGAGAGYQASIISKLIGPQGILITLEVIPELVQIAKHNLQTLQLTNVNVYEADGSEGFPTEAPFDKIIITAACPTIPQPIIDQLNENGIVIAPVGDLRSQTMVKGTKVNGHLELEFLGPFVFVPMKGKYGFKEEP